MLATLVDKRHPLLKEELEKLLVKTVTHCVGCNDQPKHQYSYVSDYQIL